jgi:hypothetical protein
VTRLTNSADENIVNRLSPLQRAILEILQSVPGPGDDVDEYGRTYIGHMPTTGDIIDKLGRPRDGKSYASVSRSLDRLMRSGLVVGAYAEICIRGKGRRYALAAACETSKLNPAERTNVSQ